MTSVLDLPPPHVINANLVRFSMRLVLSTDSRVMKVYQESAEENRAIFLDYLQRQLKLPNASDTQFLLHHAIQTFPLSPDGSTSWYETDLSANLIIKPISVEPPVTIEADGRPIQIDMLRDAVVAIEEIDVEFSPNVDARMSCMVLSCLLQYTASVFGTQRYLGALRRCILTDLVQEIKRRSLVQFDAGNLHTALEEWIGMPREFEDGDSVDDTAIGSSGLLTLPEGRSAGIVITGPKGVGKSHFSKDVVRTIRQYAPWLVTVLTLKRFENPESVETDLTSSKFFDSRVLREIASSKNCSPVKTIFDAMKAIHVPGKIVITFIDDIDSLTTQGADLVSELTELITSAEYEFFIFGATGDAHASGGVITSAERSYYLQQFRTLNIYSLSLENAYEYIIDHICNPPLMPFPKSIMKCVKSCGRAAKLAISFLSYEERRATLASRKKIELRLHNMGIGDLNKIILQTSIFLANRFSEESDLMQIRDDVEYLRIFEDALESIINSIDVIMGLGPEVIASSDWIRHDTHYHPSIPSIVKSIYEKATNYSQYIHFIKLTPPGEDVSMSNNLESLSQAEHILPSSSSFSLLYHLHRKFAFNSSFILESPNQLLNSDKKQSKSSGGLSPVGRLGNPFDDYYWHHRHALLLMPHLETLVGFQQETRISTTTSSNIGRSTGASTNTSHSLGSSVGVTLGLVGHFMHTLGFGESTVQGIALGTSTGLGVSSTLGAALNFGGNANWGWSQGQNLGKSTGTNVAKATTLMPNTTFALTQSATHTAGKSLSEGKSEGESVGESREEKRTFRHQEAMTKVVVGLKNISENRIRDLEKLRNLVIIFYTHDGCYQEVVRNRLGWNAQGEYPSRPVGCAHYHRYLRMKAPCCNKWVDCEKCHDARFKDHKMNRKVVQEIQCMHCYVRQPVPSSDEDVLLCSNPNCGRRLAVAGCLECRLWRDYLPPDGFKHCHKCEKCYPTRFYDFHYLTCSPSS